MEKFIFLALLSSLLLHLGAVGGAQVPAIFVFGDSLLDPGNNNQFKTFAKANFPPNGIDFSLGPTGRFCNGATIVDYLETTSAFTMVEEAHKIGFLLGFDLIPAYNDPSTQGSKVLQGVNFASSSAGILNDTGSGFGRRLSMHDQVDAFGNQIVPLLNSQVLSINEKVLDTQDFLAKSLFISNIGNNDFLNTYLLLISNPLQKPIPPNYADTVIAQYTIHLKNLYKYGARKILVAGLAPLGCIPAIIGSYSKDVNECYEPHNQVVMEFNVKMKKMVQQLNKKFPSAYFLYWDVYPLFIQISNNPSQYGFKYAHSACCGGGRANGGFLCNPLALLCPDRADFIFWDPFHPSDSANKIAATQAYEGTLQKTYPMNVKQLLHL